MGWRRTDAGGAGFEVGAITPHSFPKADGLTRARSWIPAIRTGTTPAPRVAIRLLARKSGAQAADKSRCERASIPLDVPVLDVAVVVSRERLELAAEESPIGESLVPVGLTPSAPYADAWMDDLDIEALAEARVRPMPTADLRRPA